MRGVYLGLLLALIASPLGAQADDITSPCVQPTSPPAGFRQSCFAAAQAMASLPPQLGALVAGGNPVLGSHSTGGLRLGRYVRTDAALRFRMAGIRTPDLRAAAPGGGSGGGTFSTTVPALSGDLALGVYSGMNLSPRVGGLGSVDLLGSVTWLPLRPFGTAGFSRAGSPLAFGVGARAGLLREGFTTPGISLSLMHHRLGEVAFGDLCPRGTADAGGCARPGDAGELDFDLRSWSGRAVIGRRFVGVGLTAGAGYDRFTAEGQYAVREGSSAADAVNMVTRSSVLERSESRWSLFTNLSYTLLLATLAAEIGWMEGGSPLPGLEQSGTEFRARRGTLFGSIGGRLAF